MKNYISIQKWNNVEKQMECAFCGAKLPRLTNNMVGRDKMVWYGNCSCTEAIQAQLHNESL